MIVFLGILFLAFLPELLLLWLVVLFIRELTRK
jgi:hypothetical protein